MNSLNRDREKAFNNWRHNSVHLTFPNGNKVSCVWGNCTYSDNHDSIEEFQVFKDSDTCEIMILEAPERLVKRIYKKFDRYYGDPMGYVTMAEWLEIIKMLSK